ncbi:MAG: valine--tRNA ligase [Armatimonadetes bacterium]|nr:valine--tRNA ligase [Armatimonadota bacterium]
MDIEKLPKVYDPFQVEEKWYNYWLEKNYFHAEVGPGSPRYCITIPPPNVTGSLHMGHALCYTIHDVLGRWHRMKGLNTLILPGTDHAGIATQNKVEQQLAEEGLTRFDLGREKFLERVWQWKEHYGGTIIMQLKRLGCSFDWERERFTMDPGYADAVLEAFVRMFDKGIIYRGARVVNWCPRCHTGISDLEVEYEEEHSYLWFIKYPLKDGAGHIQVATTRPETMLGDTAVAVNPEDKRYMESIGKTAILPIMEREIPILDDAFVDPEFGTGAVKVTPAHDPNDFEIGLRHNLPQVVVIGPEGIMTEEAGKYAGLDRYEARRRIVDELKEKGLLAKVEDYTHSVGTCSRCETVIEPLLSEQWFVRMKELAQPAIDAVKEGRVRFVPERYTRIYLDWMENIKDWNISRQLWWGHRIPVWKCRDDGRYTAARNYLEASQKLGSTDIEQDTDVLDTWFSSALWPFATFGWPEKTPEMDYFYPTDVLITARDIIYLWVARMIFQSLQFLDEIPFYDVYIYATVLNEEGRRMSKSLGTGVDPLDLIERFGSDALRYALVQQAGMGQDMRFSDARVENTRNFGNKIWNISRFVLMNLETGNRPENPKSKIQNPKLEDRWILSRLNRVIRTVNNGFENYDMDDAARSLYEFLWSEFADWYVELAKPRLRTEERAHVQYMLWRVLEASMRLLHPIMPFITEEIWQALPHEGESIMVAPFPEADESLIDEEAEREMEFRTETTRRVRELKTYTGVPLRQSKRIYLAPQPESIFEDYSRRLMQDKSFMPATSGTHVEQVIPGAKPPTDMEVVVTQTAGATPVYMEAPAMDREKELSKIDSELASIEKDFARSLGKLSNEQFISKAPAEVVEKERRIAAELEGKKREREERKKALGG